MRNTPMKHLIKYSFTALIILATLSSCGETRQKATDKINELNERADELNAALDEGIRNIESIDSVVRSGAEQIKKYDSLVNKSASKIDSIAKEKTKVWEDLTNF